MASYAKTTSAAAAPTTLTVKLVRGAEIRRVTLANPQALDSYEGLKKLATQLFGNLPEDSVFQYVDADGDTITVSSDIEVHEAVRNASQVRFSIVARASAAKQSPRKTTFTDFFEGLMQELTNVSVSEEDNEEKKLQEERIKRRRDACAAWRAQRHQQAGSSQCHWGGGGSPAWCNSSNNNDAAGAAAAGPVVHAATCDGCQARIVGLRFKCQKCPDYDLCELCYAQNISGGYSVHPEAHNFEKIERPRWPFRGCHRSFVNPNAAPETQPAPASNNNTTTPAAPLVSTASAPAPVAETVPLTPLVPAAAPAPAVQTAPSAPQVSEVSQTTLNDLTFEQKLAQLESIGFTDRRRNIEVLLNTKGDLVRAVHALI